MDGTHPVSSGRYLAICNPIFTLPLNQAALLFDYTGRNVVRFSALATELAGGGETCQADAQKEIQEEEFQRAARSAAVVS